MTKNYVPRAPYRLPIYSQKIDMRNDVSYCSCIEESCLCMKYIVRPDKHFICDDCRAGEHSC